MTSFIAAGGSGRSTSVIPAVPAAWSVTTIAFMGIASSVICLWGALIGACHSRTNADDRLPADPLGRIESRDGIVEGCDIADVRPQPSVPHPPDDLTQLGAIGLDNEIARQAVGGARPRRPSARHRRPSAPNQPAGPLLNVAADDIEHQVDAADVFQRVIAEVDELLRAEVEHLLTVGGASGPEAVRTVLTRELRHHRPS